MIFEDLKQGGNMYDLENMKGVLFENKKKSKDIHPHMNGQVIIDGKRYNIAQWHGQTKNGDPIYKIQLSEIYEK